MCGQNAFFYMPLERQIIDVIIPAYNEEESIGKVINDIPRELVREIIVCNNASSDNTAANAKKEGATVIDQPMKGYGNACLKGIEHIDKKKAGRIWGAWEAMDYFSIAMGALIGSIVVTYIGFYLLFIMMAVLCFFSAIYIYLIPRKVL